MLSRNDIARIDPDRAGRRCRSGIAADAVGENPPAPSPRGLGYDGRNAGCVHPRRRRLGRIADADGSRGVFRGIQCRRDRDGDGLPEKSDLIVLEHVEALAHGRIDEPVVLLVRQARCVVVGEDRDHAGKAHRGARIDRHDPAQSDRAGNDYGMRLAGLVELRRVAGRARHFAPAVDARQCGTDRRRRHVPASGSPAAIARARVIVRRNRSTLK